MRYFQRISKMLIEQEWYYYSLHLNHGGHNSPELTEKWSQRSFLKNPPESLRLWVVKLFASDRALQIILHFNISLFFPK